MTAIVRLSNMFALTLQPLNNQTIIVMKTKLLFFLLSVAFIIPMNAMAYKKHPRKVHAKIRHAYAKAISRSSSIFDLNAAEANDILIITFQSPLKDAEITVTDNTGNVVASESSTVIYEGKTVCIFNPDSYPYLIEINSPQLDLGAEVTLEEN